MILVSFSKLRRLEMCALVKSAKNYTLYKVRRVCVCARACVYVRTRTRVCMYLFGGRGEREDKRTHVIAYNICAIIFPYIPQRDTTSLPYLLAVIHSFSSFFFQLQRVAQKTGQYKLYSKSMPSCIRNHMFVPCEIRYHFLHNISSNQLYELTSLMF